MRTIVHAREFLATARAVASCLLLCGAVFAALLIVRPMQAQQPQPQKTDAAKDPESQSGNNDLGRQSPLRRHERPFMFQVSSDTQYFHDSNVLLADGDLIKQGADTVLLQSFGASFTPPLVERLTSTVFYHHEMVRYDRLSEFDFDADTAGLRLAYPAENWCKVYGGFSAARHAFEGDGGEFYKFYDTRLGVVCEQPLTRRALLTYGCQFDWRPSSPASLSRVDEAVYAGLNVALMDKLTAQLNYRLRAREYLEAGRTDLDHLAVLTLGYAFNNHVTVRVFASYGDNVSTVKTHDYQVLTTGGGLHLTFKF